MKILTDYLIEHFHSVQVSKENQTDPVFLELALKGFPGNKPDIPAQEMDRLFRRSEIQPDGLLIDGPNKENITTFAFSFDASAKNIVLEIAETIQATYDLKAKAPAVAAA